MSSQPVAEQTTLEIFVLAWGEFFEAWELFYRAPTLTGTLAGGLLGLLGVYIVLRRMIFLSAAVSQASGLGVAYAFYVDAIYGVGELTAHGTHHGHVEGDSGWLVELFSRPLFVAMLFSLAATLTLAWRSDVRRRNEQLLGLVYLFGAGGMAVLLAQVGTESHNVTTLLLGNPVVVLERDFQMISWLAAVLGVVHLVFARGFVQASFDPEGARVRGLPVRSLDVVLLVSLAVAVSACTRVLGALPVFAFSVLPAMAAVRLSPNVGVALVVATLIGAGAGFFGYFLAFVYRVPVGAVQTVLAVGLVALAEALRQGIRLAQRARHRLAKR